MDAVCWPFTIGLCVSTEWMHTGLVIVFTLYTYLFIGLQWCIFRVIEGHISNLRVHSTSAPPLLLSLLHLLFAFFFLYLDIVINPPLLIFIIHLLFNCTTINYIWFEVFIILRTSLEIHKSVRKKSSCPDCNVSISKYCLPVWQTWDFKPCHQSG